MNKLYLDIETTGFDFNKDDIITIQYQYLDINCRPVGNLNILKSWESSEEQIISDFYKLFFPKGYPYTSAKMKKDSEWFFVPVMTNHIFDLSFIFAKFKKYNLACPDLAEHLYSKPKIDIKDSLIIANDYSFQGSGLDNMTNKQSNGSLVPVWYNNKEYSKIIEYIEDESKSFLEALSYLNEILRDFKYGLKNIKHK
jgi:hypothetical protein